MTCRCRDMEKKRCRWEHKSSTWNKGRKLEAKNRRTTEKHDRKKKAD